MLGERETFGINRSFDAPEKNFSINFSEQGQNFAWGYVIMGIIVTCLLTGKKSSS